LALKDRVLRCAHCGLTQRFFSAFGKGRVGAIPPLPGAPAVELRPIPPPPTLLGAKEGEAWWGVDEGSSFVSEGWVVYVSGIPKWLDRGEWVCCSDSLIVAILAIVCLGGPSGGENG
jgi:hypothetical protein